MYGRISVLRSVGLLSQTSAMRRSYVHDAEVTCILLAPTGGER